MMYHDVTMLGKVKAKQQALHKDDQSKALSLLIHGDGSFAGQVTFLFPLLLVFLLKFVLGHRSRDYYNVRPS